MPTASVKELCSCTVIDKCLKYHIVARQFTDHWFMEALVNSSFSESRRRFLYSAAFMTSGVLLSSCVRRIPTSLPAANPADPLTVDIHCHFFNGTDLQMQRFLQYVQDATGAHPGEAAAASLAQDFNWLIAPSGTSEMKKLRAEEISEVEAHKKREKARADSYGKFRNQLPEAQKSAWPRNYKDYANTRASLAGGPYSAFKEYFQYRYVALADYLDLYNGQTNRTMDLIIAHVVDYDWPLNDGKPTRTPLDVQVKLMERISFLSRGRVHTFAPFDPFREIAYQAGIPGADWSALGALKRWVKDNGCIGVKIYPPMGFAPYGNYKIDLERWRKEPTLKWLGDVEHIRDGKGGTATIAQRLDDVLRELYTWCLEQDLPVMAHTDLSNGPNEKYDHFPSAKHWDLLRSEFGGLRVNFGHLGGFEDTSVDDWNMTADPSARKVNARELVALMSSDASAPGGRFFGDSAYTQKVLSDRADLLKVYKAALSWKAAGQLQPVLQNRMMYGSDWSLLMLEKDMQEYFSDFVWMYSQLDESLPSGESTETLSNKFFGENAVDYLGLRDGRTRQRLTDFYATRGMTFQRQGQPVWMRKIKS
jgi:hypothetical protein